jgi:hypothetical protein
VRKIALLLVFLVSPMAVLAQEAETTPPAPEITAAQIEFRPPMNEVLTAFHRSGLGSAATTVSVAYDDSGNVTAAKLQKPTRSRTLDAAILVWAARVKIKARESGLGSLPINFEMH